MGTRKEEPTISASHLELLDKEGFEAITYQNVSILVECEDGTDRREWLPEDCVNWEKRLFIRYRTDDTYDFPGWEPVKGHQFGGRHRDVRGAIGWFHWLEQQRAQS